MLWEHAEVRTDPPGDIMIYDLDEKTLWGVGELVIIGEKLRVRYYEVGGETEYHKHLSMSHPLTNALMEAYPHAIQLFP